MTFSVRDFLASYRFTFFLFFFFISIFFSFYFFFHLLKIYNFFYLLLLHFFIIFLFSFFYIFFKKNEILFFILFYCTCYGNLLRAIYDTSLHHYYYTMSSYTLSDIQADIRGLIALITQQGETIKLMNERIQNLEKKELEKHDTPSPECKCYE